MSRKKQGKAPVGAVMVVGGGIAGIEASLNLADGGYKVYLVEKSESIGGTMARLDKTFPTNDCSMCILSPKLVECGRHLNIETISFADVVAVEGKPGDFLVTVRERSRYIDPDKCTGCGECAAACPVEWEDEFNAGLGKRKAVYRPFPQAFPNVFTIDKRERGPCATGCPGGINIQAFVALIAARKYKEALRVIRESIAFPSVCGRVCHHPCEYVCKRGEYDSPISIMALKRFVADTVGEEDLQLPPREPAKKEKVAVIGAGPAGLSAAFELAKLGYPVEVFEALPEPGGMLAVGIPEYRLPRAVLMREIRRIEKMGVVIHTGRRLGEDFSIGDLKRRGYRAGLLAIGAHVSRRLGIEGEDARGVLDCVGFLRDVNLGRKVKIGKKVAVVGGGNAAVDSARVANRLGDAEVTILYRRTRAEMPADADEIEEALKEGVKIEYLVAPVRVLKKRGRTVGLVCCRMRLGDPDESGRRRPVPIEGSEFVLDVDTVIVAISQGPDLSFAKGKLETTRWGTIKTVDGSTATSMKGVFACGDAVTGPNTVIDAIAEGKQAAGDIHAYLSGGGVETVSRPANVMKSRGFPDFVPRRERVSIPRIEVYRRIRNFEEVDLTLSEEEAVAEAQRCLACGVCSECMECVAACKAEAIDHFRADRLRHIRVGAVILAPGFREFDPSRKFDFGYSRSRNILSSMEFERMLSASGPFGGRIVRPSDHGKVRRVAFIQCVGSRDEKCGNTYCSSVCCMYAVKEAVIAKEHDSDISSTVFYMDIRAHGKDFDAYVERAEKEYGVEFKRSRVSSVEEDSSGKIVVSYEDEEGRFRREYFDLAVLSVGLEPAEDTRSLAELFGVERGKDGFFAVDPFRPLDTSRDGVFVCGAASGPRDIPESVMQASGAAARAASVLAESRGTLTESKTYPPERNVFAEPPRIGVFVCHCGINIGGVVDVPSVVEYARNLPNVAYAEENLYTCSQDTQERIREIISREGLNRVVVASCSPRTHEPLFQETLREAGLNPHLFEMANIRDQCSWVHMREKDAATEKAKDLVRMAVAKVRRAVPLRTRLMDVTPEALVIGGGVGGMTAAAALADQGFVVHLVEKQAKLGGNALSVPFTIEGRDVRRYLDSLTRKMLDHPLIHVYTSSEVVEAYGYVGNFVSTVLTKGKKRKHRIAHGVVVIATGGREHVPSGFLYGKNPRVMTQLDLERKIVDSPSFFREVRDVVMIQCVESRNGERPYCSRICCLQAVKNALALKTRFPETNVYVLYRDMRTYGLYETYYREARRAGVVFMRYTPDEPPEVKASRRKRGGVRVSVLDRLLGDRVSLHADLLVLSVPVEPSADNHRLAVLYKVPLNADGFFLEAHVKLRPVDFATDGVFLCGTAHYPKNISETTAQALAAAAKAAVVLSRPHIEAEARTAEVNEARCVGCGACTEVCAYQAIELDAERGVARVNEALCKGCGACAATCRTAAVDVKGFRDDQILNVLKAV